MANRAMAAKVERARKQAGALAAAEYSKPFYQGNATLGAAKARSAATAELVTSYLRDGGKVQLCQTRAHEGQRIKGGCALGYASPGRALIRPGTHYLFRK